MRLATFLVLAGAVSLCGAELNSINPAVKKVVESVSEQRIADILKQLESFQTRNIFSAQDAPGRGIGAARKWISGQLQSYSPRLQVRDDGYRVKKKGRIAHDVDIHNVVAVLPGRLNPDRQIIISGHYDSLVLNRRPPSDSGTGASEADPAPEAPQIADPAEYDAKINEQPAPGVTDDGSGTAAVLELARIMSQYEWDNTLVFIAFSGEEEGLVGSTLYARKAHNEKQVIDAVFNNDIIGSEISGNGRINNSGVLLFSEDPMDSPSRELARYIKHIAERYIPSMNVDLVFRQDRFGRGGDHIPFNEEGYAAVRFTSPNENYANQHTATDIFANTSVPYTARVIQVNAAALATLALAPKAPVILEQITRGPRKGRLAPMLGRGKTRYDAQLRWKNEKPEPDLAGYMIMLRSTTAPYWQRELFVGNVTEYIMKDVPIDECVFGVKAVDRDGNESLAAVYTIPPRPKLEIETY